ncbi:hypothetical protein [Yersinia enterocolitica]|nr:hypothetical protein [Yersinia enterocolitica]
MGFTYIIISVHIPQPGINRWRFFESITTISWKGKVEFLPFQEMLIKVEAWTVSLMSTYLTACTALGTANYQTIRDCVTAKKVNQIIRSEIMPSVGENHEEVISRVSSAFLGTLYVVM